MNVDFGIPEKCLHTIGISKTFHVSIFYFRYAYLIPITPRVRLTSDIHVRVLGLLFKRRFVGFVLPVLGPQAPGVDAGDAEGGDDDEDGELAPEIWVRVSQCPLRWCSDGGGAPAGM